LSLGHQEATEWIAMVKGQEAGVPTLPIRLDHLFGVLARGIG
jgi:hypothetical protein